ncbi:hypothetical protein AB832_00720 [Flavobacteriaceae bacterium (ex Bugula neritina AB1)]|nr:hypothetical protein AB832_00720 [Flavobacteriaceae bacterium (ex Bugula neritina AB1)]
MPGPIATIGSMHVCPMCSGTVPHVGGPVSGPGAPNILINGKPAALMGDMCVCVGPPDVIAQGAPSVFFNGVPVACQGDMTAHGGVISQGEPNVIIGTAVPVPPVTMPAKKIPFPKITLINKVMGNAKEAIANQEKLKNQEEEEEPRIYNLQWVKEEEVIRSSRVMREVTLRASVQNIPDGETVTFKVTKPIENTKEENTSTTEEEVIELKGTVKDKSVEVVWEIEEREAETTN